MMCPGITTTYNHTIRGSRTSSAVSLLLRLAPIAVACVGFGGCALTVHDINVDYKYTRTSGAELASTPLQVAAFTDARGNENPRMIWNSRNLHGNTMSGGWQAQKPVAEIVRDGVAQGLAAAHANLADSPHSLILGGELMEYSYQVVSGMWTGTLTTKLTVKFRLKTTQGATLWNDTFTGTTQYHGTSMPGVDMLLGKSLDSLVTQLVDDDLFRQRLSHPTSP